MIQQFLKSTKLIARVFLILWVVCCTLFTVIAWQNSSSENAIASVIALIFFYLLFSASFLIPAITITQSQQAKARSRETRYSPKSYWITVVSALLLGAFGAHRFYTGKKLTGWVYFFTAGGLLVGWIVDLFLVATGAFLDSDGCVIVRPGQERHIAKEREDAVEEADANEMFYKQDARKMAEVEPRPLFSDVEVLGAQEKKQAIPQKQRCAENTALSYTPVVNIRFTPTERAEREEQGYEWEVYSVNPAERFISDMKKYANKEETDAQFVPFMQYWPTYDSMDSQQKAWYFYWRTQVRNGQYPDTDLSYIFIHIYELLSGIGWNDPAEGYNQLMALWMSYRDRFPKLDHYLFGWGFDFARLHHLKFDIPDISNFQIFAQSTVIDMCIDLYQDEKPLKLPFPLICALCDYTITASKFYKAGHEQLLQSAIPRAVALADAFLWKEKGKGILSMYGPSRTKKQTYYVFQSAVCPDANKKVEISVKGYSTSAKLRNYINQLVRYSENVLRGLYGYRGRLRGVELNEELSVLVESFLKKEYNPKKNRVKTEIKPVQVELDFNSIDELREQSDAVRDALEVQDCGEQKELLTELPEVSAMFEKLSVPAKKFLLSLKDTQWETEANKAQTQLVEEINAAAIRFLSQGLIVVEAGRYIVEDDYRDELDYIYQENSDAVIAEEAEITESMNQANTVDVEDLSVEVKDFLEALTDVQRKTIAAVLFSNNPEEKLAQLADETMSMPEILIDDINALATEFLDDILIKTVDDTPTVLGQYAGELKRAVKFLEVL